MSAQPNRRMKPTPSRRRERLKDEWSQMVMRDIEGKALRERATEPGGEEVSIMKDEVKAKLPPAAAELELVRPQMRV